MHPSPRVRAAARRPRLLAAVAAIALAVAGVACGGDAEPISGGASEELRAAAPSRVCPARFVDANGAACAATLTCTYAIDCGPTPQQTRCSCVSGALACTDRVGDIPVGEPQLCAPSAAADTSECPLSRALAEGRACPVVGRLCAYRGSPCPIAKDVQLLDSCRCRPDGTGGFVFRCESPLCAPPG